MRSGLLLLHLLRRFIFHLRRLNNSRLGLVMLQSLLLDMLLLLLLLTRLLLLGWRLRYVLWVLRLSMLLLLRVLLLLLAGVLRVLCGMLSMWRVLVLRVLLLLGRVLLRHGEGRLNGARMLLVVLLSWGLRVRATIVDRLRVAAATHVGRLDLSVGVMLLLAVPGRVSSERRLVLCLHWHRGLRLRRPCRRLLNDPPLLLH